MVDPTWDVIQPLSLAPGVETGGLEVIAHIRANGLLVDCRRAGYLASGTVPTAVNIAHAAIVSVVGSSPRTRRPSYSATGPPCRER